MDIPNKYYYKFSSNYEVVSSELLENLDENSPHFRYKLVGHEHMTSWPFFHQDPFAKPFRYD